MIEFTNSENQLKYSLTSNGYQFSDINSMDDDWLIINSKVTVKGNVFEKTDPSLEVREILNLRNWFYNLSINSIPEFTYCCFTEPCLEFQLFGNQNGIIRYGIKLDLELKPDFQLNTFSKVEDDFIMVFENTFDELKKITHLLDKEYKKYPSRKQKK
jgi:hypothetical protein